MHTGDGPQVKEEMLLSRYSMFLPKSVKEIFHDYPELKKHDEFKRMSQSDAVFCWYMGHRASPICHWEPEDRKVSFAIKNSYLGKLAPEKYNRLMDMNFSEEIREGIERMRTFNLSARIRFLKISETVINSWEEIANTKIDFSRLSEGDNIKEAKEYVNSTKAIITEMPKLLDQLEQKYSINLNEDADDESDKIGFLDDYHDTNAKGTAK